ncbi:MAG TPA: hypothetical protein VN088_07990 [Nocardioides sp.]|nr:hypothetical protein [Nocardioides sp.]
MSDAVPTFPPRLTPSEAALEVGPGLLPEVDPAAPVVDMPVEPPPELGPRPVEAPAGVDISYEQFGRHYIRRVLNPARVADTIDALLGPTIELGPMGAGPGRAFASVKVFGRFTGCSAAEIPGDLLTYAVDLPIAVTFTLELPFDTLTFDADVVVPLKLIVHTAAPTIIKMELLTPTEDQVGLSIQPSTRRGAVFQKMTGLESELRRFLLKVVRVELAKPYIRKAMELDMEDLIEKAWGELSKNFLPQSPEDRKV